MELHRDRQGGLKPASPRTTPRVAVFLLYHPLWSSPSILNAVTLLAERGYAVDIFTDSEQPPRFVHGGDLPIRVHLPRPPSKQGAKEVPAISWGSPVRPGIPRRSRRLLPGAIADLVGELWTVLRWRLPRAPVLHCIRRAWSVSGAHGPYTCFIGAEPYGLMAATVLGLMRGVPTIYWSLELWPWKESRGLVARIRKILECLCHRRAEFTIIQDEDRARFVARENRTRPASPFVIVPAAARGPARAQRGDDWRTRLGIPRSQKILLYAGSIETWSRPVELVVAAQDWPADWVLLLHGFGSAELIDQVRGHCRVPGRVHLSFEVLPYHELDSLISSADIGLAFYEDLGPNWSLIGSASGKLSHYLKCGLPVITNSFPSIERIVDAYGCGICVPSPAQIAEAARKIFSDYTTYRANAVRCFEEKLEFSKHFGEVVLRIEELRSGRGE